MFGLGVWEMAIIGIIAVLLFGKRLPEIARSAGKSLTEFKRGMTGLEDDVQSAASTARRSYQDDYDDHEPAKAPKFEPPSSEPQDESSPAESKTA